MTLTIHLSVDSREKVDHLIYFFYTLCGMKFYAEINDCPVDSLISIEDSKLINRTK
jgi:hypothetical protein